MDRFEKKGYEPQMKLSNDAVEALILVGGFAIVALAGLIVFLVWPTNIFGNWRVYLTLLVGAVIAIPAMIALRKKFHQPPD